MLYIVIQRPKGRYRRSFATAVAIVEANNATHAVRLAIEQQPEHISKSSNDYSAPYAEPAVAGFASLI